MYYIIYMYLYYPHYYITIKNQDIRYKIYKIIKINFRYNHHFEEKLIAIKLQYHNI